MTANVYVYLPQKSWRLFLASSIPASAKTFRFFFFFFPKNQHFAQGQNSRDQLGQTVGELENEPCDVQVGFLAVWSHPRWSGANLVSRGCCRIRPPGRTKTALKMQCCDVAPGHPELCRCSLLRGRHRHSVMTGNKWNNFTVSWCKPWNTAIQSDICSSEEEITYLRFADPHGVFRMDAAACD